MQYRHYVRRVLFGAVGVLLSIVVLNCWVDPGNLFFKNELLVKTCGKWLLEGHDVAITQNYDERMLQKYLIEHDTMNYDVLVIGSSRTMDIGRDLFSGYAVKNYSVSGASIEDDIALYFLYERLHGTPRKVVIGGDAWLLNANNEQNRWRSLSKEYEYGKRKISGRENFRVEPNYERYLQLLSWAYLKESLMKVRKEGLINLSRGYNQADDKSAVASNANVICPDGAHIPSVDSQTREVEPLVRKYISGDIYSLERFSMLDDELKESVTEFLSYLRMQNVEVVLYLTPYHPIVYSYFLHSERYHNVMETEVFFQKFSEKYGIKIIGSFDPMQCDLSDEDFLDGMHMRRAAVERVFIAEQSGHK